MVKNIIYAIRRMKCQYYERYGKRGAIICLDANAEARLTAYIMHELAHPYHEYSIIASLYSVEEILEDGIRSLWTICGMRVRFDCPSFCIECDNQERETGIPCFECEKRSGIDCPGRKFGEATRCKVCMHKFMKSMD